MIECLKNLQECLKYIDNGITKISHLARNLNSGVWRRTNSKVIKACRELNQNGNGKLIEIYESHQLKWFFKYSDHYMVKMENLYT